MRIGPARTASLCSTRMPAFGAGGQSAFTAWYDGDMRAQADAMWAYFTLAEFSPPPSELATPGTTKLAVGERRLPDARIGEARPRAVSGGARRRREDFTPEEGQV